MKLFFFSTENPETNLVRELNGARDNIISQPLIIYIWSIDLPEHFFQIGIRSLMCTFW